MIEYFRAWFFIDTYEDIKDSRVQFEMNKRNMNSISGLMDNMVDIRNVIVHIPFDFPSSCIKFIKYIKQNNTEENIKMFCSVFEEDAKEFEVIYKDVMYELGMYEYPEDDFPKLHY